MWEYWYYVIHYLVIMVSTPAFHLPINGLSLLSHLLSYELD